MNTVTITLNADQLGKSTVTLTDAQLAAIAAQEAAPSTTPPTGTVAAFVAPPAAAGREQMKTDMKWQNGPSLYAPAPLTDSNAWLIGFTCGTSARGSVSCAEYQDPAAMRNWAFVRNRDGAILAQGNSMQEPSVRFGTPTSRLDSRVPLAVGERYTLAVWNATPGQSGRMVTQMYL